MTVLAAAPGGGHVVPQRRRSRRPGNAAPPGRVCSVRSRRRRRCRPTNGIAASEYEPDRSAADPPRF